MRKPQVKDRRIITKKIMWYDAMTCNRYITYLLLLSDFALANLLGWSGIEYTSLKGVADAVCDKRDVVWRKELWKGVNAPTAATLTTSAENKMRFEAIEGWVSVVTMDAVIQRDQIDYDDIQVYVELASDLLSHQSRSEHAADRPTFLLPACFTPSLRPPLSVCCLLYGTAPSTAGKENSTGKYFSFIRSFI